MAKLSLKSQGFAMRNECICQNESIDRFLSEICESDVDGKEDGLNLHISYRKFCKTHRCEPLDFDKFCGMLTDKYGFERYAPFHLWFYGIKLKKEI